MKRINFAASAKWSFERKTIYSFIFITLALLIIFLALIPVQRFLWSGWLYGTGSMALSYLVSYVFVGWVLRRRFKKRASVMLAFLSSTMSLFFQALFFIALIMINNAYFGSGLFAGKLANMVSGPVNFFTYLAGLSAIMIAIVLATFWARPKDK